MVTLHFYETFGLFNPLVYIRGLNKPKDLAFALAFRYELSLTCHRFLITAKKPDNKKD